MKQLLVTAIAVIITFCVYSQNDYRSNKEYAKVPVEMQNNSMASKTNSNENIQIGLKESNAVMVDRYEIGRSNNVYSVLVSEHRSLSYEYLTGTILALFRADPETQPGTQFGDVVAHTSTNSGIDWDHMALKNPDTSEYSFGYHSGFLYNQNGTASYENLYAVSIGADMIDFAPHISIASQRLDGNNYTANYYPLENNMTAYSLAGITNIENQAFLSGAKYSVLVSQGTDQTMLQYVFSTDDPAYGYELDTTYTYQPDWKVDTSDGHHIALYTTWSAWALDGSIGYMWIIGVTNETYNYGVYQPQLAYTTDGGSTWNPLSINLEDHPTLVQFLPPWEDAAGNPGTVRPSFLTADRTFPGVVDYEGKLHLFSNVFGSSRGDVLDPDNGYWVVDEQYGGHIFDFIIDQNGLVDVVFVDSVRTDVSPDNAFGDVSWDHRLQAAKSPDELSVFCVWAEDIHSEQSELLTPDIKGWGYIASDQIIMGDGSINFTGHDLFSGFYLFHYLGEIATWDPPNCFWLHISTSLSIEEFQVNDPLAPVTHTYLGGIGFCASNIDTHTLTMKDLTLTQNIPNPATAHTSFTVTGKGNSPVKLTVANMIGQEVYTEDLCIVNGNKKVYLDLSDFKSGVYFYTVSSGNESETKKMIVK